MTDNPQYIIVSGINGAGKAHINIINKAKKQGYDNLLLATTKNF